MDPGEARVPGDRDPAQDDEEDEEDEEEDARETAAARRDRYRDRKARTSRGSRGGRVLGCLFVLILLAGGGGGMWYFLKYLPEQKLREDQAQIKKAADLAGDLTDKGKLKEAVDILNKLSIEREEKDLIRKRNEKIVRYGAALKRLESGLSPEEWQRQRLREFGLITGPASKTRPPEKHRRELRDFLTKHAADTDPEAAAQLKEIRTLLGK